MELDRRQFTGALIATLFLRKGWENPSALPACPDGFSWTRSPALEAFVPCPNGWYFHEVDNDGRGSKSAYFTREDFAKTQQFFTGFVVNVVRGIPRDTAPLCKAFVILCLEGIAPLELFEDSNEDYYTYGIEKINPPKGYRVADTRIRVVGVSNKQTNTLYLVQFESPADRWGTDWQIGRQIYDMLKINPET